VVRFCFVVGEGEVGREGVFRCFDEVLFFVLRFFLEGQEFGGWELVWDGGIGSRNRE